MESDFHVSGICLDAVESFSEGHAYVSSVEPKSILIAQVGFVQCVTEQKHSISEDIR